jgi:hypothetical protein
MSQIVEQGREEWLSLIEPLLEEASTEAADSSSEFEPFPAATPTKYKTEVRCFANSEVPLLDARTGVPFP